MNLRTLRPFLISLALAVFPLSALAQSADYNVIYGFPTTDGTNPGATYGGGAIGQMAQGPGGVFYGSTIVGGPNGAGVVFSITTSGAIKAIYANCPAGGTCTNPGLLPSGFVVGPDGNLYGVSSTGGTDTYGAVFQLTPSGTMKILHSFDFNDGYYPSGQMVVGSDGTLYGTTAEGGTGTCENFFGTNDGCGTIFKVTTAGTFTSLYSFTGTTTDYSGPSGALVQGLDGNYYGVTPVSFFRFSPSTSKVTTVAVSNETTEGVYYIGAPAFDHSGNLWAAAENNGSQGCGAIAKTTLSGSISSAYSFCTQSNDTDGSIPLSPLVAGSDGNFYGTNSQAGDLNCAEGFGCGVIYEITPSGALTVLYTFSNAADGVLAGNTPTQGSDGDFYGTATNSDLCNECGVFYQLAHAPAAKPPVQLSLSASAVEVNSAVKLSWVVNNADSLSTQQCYAFGGSTDAGTWSGKQAGTYSSSAFTYSGSASITPTKAGTYTYALECDGIYEGSATLTATSGSPKVNTTTTVSVSPNPVYAGQNVSVSATVKKSSGSGTPTGSVQFSVEGDVLATVPLNGSGVASFNASTKGYAAGTYPLIATYEGDSTDNGSTSAADNVVLKAPAATTTKLTASPNPVTQPANCTLTATVTSSSGTPTGSVTFSAGGEALATVNVNGSGVASVAASSNTVPAGTYPVVATYNGATTYAKSTSSTVNVTVKQ